MKIAHGLPIPENLEEVCRPSRCGFLVYDMQAGIVPQIAEGADILNRCQDLLAAAREGGYRIFFTRHFFLPSRAAGVGQLRRSMVWQHKSDPMEIAPFLLQGSSGYEIVPELKPRADEVVLDKITMSAFEGTFLNLAMRDAHLDAYVIAGIALEVGIEPTVRQGLDLNYLPIVVSDACGSRTDDIKQHSLHTLAETGEVWTATTREVVEIMRRGEP